MSVKHSLLSSFVCADKHLKLGKGCTQISQQHAFLSYKYYRMMFVQAIIDNVIYLQSMGLLAHASSKTMAHTIIHAS